MSWAHTIRMIFVFFLLINILQTVLVQKNHWTHTKTFVILLISVQPWIDFWLYLMFSFGTFRTVNTDIVAPCIEKKILVTPLRDKYLKVMHQICKDLTLHGHFKLFYVFCLTRSSTCIYFFFCWKFCFVKAFYNCIDLAKNALNWVNR